MKILLIEMCNFENFPTGGQLTFAKNMVSAFKEDIRVVGMSTDLNEPIGKWFTKRIENTEIQYFSCGFTRPRKKKSIIPTRISNWRMFKRYLPIIEKSSEFDLIFLQSPEVTLPLPNRLIKKAILMMPGVSNPLSISRYPWSRPFAKIFDFFFFNKIKNAPLILATADTTAIAGFVNRSKGIISEKKVISFPTRFDGSVFFQKDKQECRQKLSLDLSKIIISTVGRLNRYKGWKLMIDSMKLFLNVHPHSLFNYIGDGEEHEKIESYINHNNLSDNIKLIGKQDSQTINEYLNASDLFVMASFTEGWSTTLLEALSTGTPAVTTNFSSAKEMIIENVNGYVLDNRCEIQFSDAMIKAIQLDKSLIEEISKKYEQYSINNLKNELTSIIEKNIDNG